MVDSLSCRSTPLIFGFLEVCDYQVIHIYMFVGWLSSFYVPTYFETLLIFLIEITPQTFHSIRPCIIILGKKIVPPSYRHQCTNFLPSLLKGRESEESSRNTLHFTL